VAIDLLVNEDGEEAMRQRAEAYWRGERWQSAGEAFERMLGQYGQSESPLSGETRMDVLRAAIAYVFAGDHLGTERLRETYGELMRNTPDEKAFEVVTASIAKDGIEFRNLAREIAALDTLEAFLEEFRQVLDGPIVEADASAS